MSHSLFLPDGILPKLSWLMKELQNNFSDNPNSQLVSEEHFEVVMVALEEDLLEMEPCLEPEPMDSPFRNMWLNCETILECLFDAWYDRSAELLARSRRTLSRIYEDLTSAESLMEPELELDFIC